MALPDKPITRTEQYLSNIAGEQTDLPEYPITREEQYLAYIAENGGGGGGGTTNYNSLTNKPKINNVELSGNKNTHDLGLDTPMKGATASADGAAGLVPAPLKGDENKFLAGDGNWKEASGSAAELSANMTAAVTVGGITAGDNYTKGTTLEKVIRDMLEPTLYPTFTAPSASVTYSADANYAVGDTIASKGASVVYNPGAITLNGTKQNNRGGAATLYTILTTGADTEYSDTSASSGTFTVPALTRSTKGSIVITGRVDYAQGAQPKDSKGNDYDSPLPAGSVSATKTINFIQPYYYGKSASSTISDFTGLTRSVTTKGEKKFSFTTNNEYMVIAYDAAYGNLKTILDPNGFDVTSGWTKSTLTVGGLSYFVYVANDPTTDTNAQFTFKY
jgi:hypothetical protein